MANSTVIKVKVDYSVTWEEMIDRLKNMSLAFDTDRHITKDRFSSKNIEEEYMIDVHYLAHNQPWESWQRPITTTELLALATQHPDKLQTKIRAIGHLWLPNNHGRFATSIRGTRLATSNGEKLVVLFDMESLTEKAEDEYYFAVVTTGQNPLGDAEWKETEKNLGF